MAKAAVIPPAIIRKLLDYNPETGTMVWRRRELGFFSRPADQRTWNTKFAGKPAFTTARFGYRVGEIFNKPLPAHRVAWAIFYGKWPDEIDHINGDRSDNRIANLRDVTRAENNRNMKRSRKNTSGVTGVSIDHDTGKWRAQIGVNGRAVVLGLFEKLEDAAAARMVAEKRYGYHPNHGRDPSVGREP